MGAKTKHHCRLDNNITDVEKYIPTVTKGGKKELDGCYVYVNASSRKEKESCENGWTYYLKGREQTIISEVIIIMYSI